MLTDHEVCSLIPTVHSRWTWMHGGSKNLNLHEFTYHGSKIPKGFIHFIANMAKEAILETITDFHAVAIETESAFLSLWSANHVKATCKSCYGTVQIIRKLKNFAGYRLRKHLVESLVLSKLDYCDTVYYPLPEFQLKRLQRVQLVAASFVLNRYVNDINDIVKIGWLPVRQRRDFHVLKLVHQALYSPSWPSYVPLDTVKHLRSLRSGAATRLTIPMERGTFQDSAAKLFNVLPANIRNCSDFKVYCREVNAYLLNNICK